MVGVKNATPRKGWRFVADLTQGMVCESGLAKTVLFRPDRAFRPLRWAWRAGPEWNADPCPGPVLPLVATLG
jgi:hypothetical protein